MVPTNLSFHRWRLTAFLYAVILAFNLSSHSALAQSLITIGPIDDGRVTARNKVWLLDANIATTFRLFGSQDLSGFGNLSLTESNTFCDNTRITTVPLTAGASNLIAEATVSVAYEPGRFFVCLDDEHQGAGDLIEFEIVPTYIPEEESEDLPVWVRACFIALLLCLSGLFSGLNLGLMALDTKELEVVMKVGDVKERGYAKKIYPLRKRGNLLLCTVLLGNVLVNNVLTILLDTLVGGVFAIVGATFGIVVFGEIIPQAICTRHGLRVGALTIPLIKFFMAVTFILAYPISRILDKTLGDELGTVFNRKHLVEMLKVQDELNDLDKEEVEIVTGALTYAERDVRDIMTVLEDVYMLPINSVLDFKTISGIFAAGHSRIPVYNEQRENIVGILYMKELAFVDPDDATELSTIIKFYKHSLQYVDDDTKLDTLLELFIKGRSHLVVVQKIVDPEDGRDKYHKNVGVATLEDVIEEIIQTEIVDETDVISDNRNKQKVTSINSMVTGLYPKELEGPEGSQLNNVQPVLTEQMALAAFTFLSANVAGFNDETILSRSVMKKLIERPECHLAIDSDSSEQKRELFTLGQQVNTFVLVLEGRVKVTVGQENFGFDAGPFSTLGTSSVSTTVGGSVPADFTAKVSSTEATLLVVPRTLYVEASKASQIEKTTKETPRSERKAFNTASTVSSASIVRRTESEPQQMQDRLVISPRQAAVIETRDVQDPEHFNVVVQNPTADLSMPIEGSDPEDPLIKVESIV